MDFELSQHAKDGYVVVELRGELDITTVPNLRPALHALLDGKTPRIILDLSELAFIDSSALTAIVIADRRARQLGVTLALAAPQRIVARVLSITGLDQHFPVYPTLADAAADVQGSPADGGQAASQGGTSPG